MTKEEATRLIAYQVWQERAPLRESGFSEHPDQHVQDWKTAESMIAVLNEDDGYEYGWIYEHTRDDYNRFKEIFEKIV